MLHRIEINVCHAIKHPAASHGVLTALFNLLAFSQPSSPRDGELNPQRFKFGTMSQGNYKEVLDGDWKEF
jgi:hypothetical protein